MVDVKSHTLANAALYAQREFPDLLKRAGVNEASLRAKLEARSACNTTPPEQSAAIPTLPAVLLKSLAIGVLLLGGALGMGGGLTACASLDDKVDAAKIRVALDTVNRAYAGAALVLEVYCVASADTPPCNSPAAMKAIEESGVVLADAIARAKTIIANAKDQDARGLGLDIAMNAVAVYAKVLRTYGVAKQ